MRISIIEINQPIGTFYIGALEASIISKCTVVKKRQYNMDKVFTFGGPQRPESAKRIKEINEYTADPDATFPTPIIIAVNDNPNNRLLDNHFEFNENETIGEIIDGQHRIKGLENSEHIDKFILPIVFMFNLSEEEKAYVFSIINSKQTKVPMSLIYDLFELTKERSPQKICHEIARLLNSDKSSPFYRRLKMLGKKEDEYSSLSQGSFIKYLLPLLSGKPDRDLLDIKNNKALDDDPKLPLRYYFIMKKDEIIYKILFNLFQALNNIFREEWENPDKYILSKTTGYGAVLIAFKDLFFLGKRENKLTIEYFEGVFAQFKNTLKEKKIELTSEHFGSNEQAQRRLADLILGKTT